MTGSIAELVERRKGDWDALARRLPEIRHGQASLDALIDAERLFQRAATDLARLQVTAPQSDAARYLHQLVGQAHATLHAVPPRRGEQLRSFFLVDYPSIVRREIGFVYVAASLLVLGLLLGALAIAFDATSISVLIPEGVRAAVESKTMWTDPLVSVSPSATSSAIATNNLTVTIVAFVSGIALGVGTAFVLVTNGLAIGAISAYCIRQSMGLPLFAFIGAHGPLELSIIVLAGAAGLMLAWAILSPGEQSRGEALRTRARPAVAMVLGSAPFLAGAGVLEGFVDPGQLAPPAVKISLGVAIALAFWLYLARAGRARSPRSD